MRSTKYVTRGYCRLCLVFGGTEASGSTDGLGGNGLARFAALYGQDRIVVGNLAPVISGWAATGYNVIDFEVDAISGIGVGRMVAKLAALFDIRPF